MDHLSTNQVSNFVMGDATPEESRHAAECPECAGKVSQLTETLSVFREAVHQWTHENGGSVFPMRPIVASEPNMFGVRPLRWALALALILLIGFPVYQTINERHRRMEAEDSLLLEQVNAHLSRGVAAPMEPWMELLSDGSADEVGGRQ